MKRICVYTCNRSEYSRLKSVMRAIVRHKDLELKIVVSGSHLLSRFGMTVRDIEEDGFMIDERIYTVIDGGTLETMTKSTGLAIIELSTYFSRIKPDLLLVIGDRYDLLPAVVCAALQNIPIAHIQGGERTGTIDESIRHVVTKFSHLHFPATEGSRDFIIQLGEKPENVIVSGCPAIDLLLESEVMSRATLFEKLAERTKMGSLPDPHSDYLLLVQHPVTTEHSEAYDQMMETLMAIHRLKKQTIMMAPNIDTGSDPMSAAIRKVKNDFDSSYLYSYRHMPIDIFFNLMRHASCMIGNSSAGIRESGYFGTPVLNIGSRQKNREYGKNVMNVGCNRIEIEKGIRAQLEHGPYPVEQIYGTGRAGEMIAEKLHSMSVKSQK